MLKKDTPRNIINVIKDLEEIIITQSGADVFSEIFKLIYAKLIDELNCQKVGYAKKFKLSENYYADIVRLFEKATDRWPNVFATQEKFNINSVCLESSVRILENINLLDFSLENITQAFEYILPEVAKKKRGQYFTPEYVIEFMVKILNPQANELIIDPACGSGGYLINTINYISKNADVKFRQKDLYGIDIDDKSAKIAEAIKIIAGDKYDYNLKKLDAIGHPFWENFGLKRHAFDCVLTNPPFAGDVTDQEVLRVYELAKNEAGKIRERMDRHILFLERIFDLLKPGGRAAVILPQGILNNRNMAGVRNYLLTNAKVEAVISLDRNIFRPYTDTKTSIIFFKRWVAMEDRRDDYTVFMAISEKSGKDRLGETIYKRDEHGNILKNEAGKFIVDHDLDLIADEYLKNANI
ncbi:MAG: N-6 DNA methylase [Candidatus Falkowbacteria bacterium]|nr:N-6 DNA methylase [Candidatus Falkowbacteria bacterium]